jgi:transcriptional regulator with XRE-family HTH domain
MKQINDELRKLLQGEKLSTLEKKTGIFPSQLSPWLRGSDFSTIQMIQKIAIAANKRVYLDGDDEDIEYRIKNIILDDTRDYSTFSLEHATGIKSNTFVTMRSGMQPRLSTLLQICDKLGIELKFELK